MTYRNNEGPVRYERSYGKIVLRGDLPTDIPAMFRLDGVCRGLVAPSEAAAREFVLGQLALPETEDCDAPRYTTPADREFDAAMKRRDEAKEWAERVTGRRLSWAEVVALLCGGEAAR